MKKTYTISLNISILFLLLISSVILKANDINSNFPGQALTPRNDQAAIIFNDDPVSSDYRTSVLKSILPADYKIITVDKNIFLIKSTSNKELNINHLLSNYSIGSSIKFITPVYFHNNKKVSIIPADEFVVRLKNIHDKDKLDHINILNGVTIIGNAGGEKGFLLKTLNNNPKNSIELTNIYNSESIFEFAEPNFYYPEYCILDYDPNDLYYPQQWALNNTGQTVNVGGLHILGDKPQTIAIPGADMDVNLAWDYQFFGNNIVKVGIFDTGIDSTHPDLRANIGGTGYDASYDLNGVPRDSNGHGTNCTGLIGAVSNNSIGVAGIASGCKLFSYKIFKSSGTTSNVIIARAFDTAVARGIGVFNNSYGGMLPSTLVTNSINNAVTNARSGLGGVLLFASGNAGNDSLDYPASLSTVIAIGASTPQDQKKAPGTGNEFYYGGNFGDNLTAVAPINCYTTEINGTYNENFGGTSCACANASGVAALILSKTTTLTSAQVRTYISRGCDKIDNVDYSINNTYGKWNEYVGYGRLNAFQSLRLSMGIDRTPPSIDHLNVHSVNSTYPVIIAAEIVDQDGSVIDSVTNKPKVFYRINKNNAGWTSYDSAIYNSRAGNVFNFKIPGQGWETQVQYNIKAYDAAANYSLFPVHGPASDSLCLCYYKVGSLTTYTDVFPAFAIPDFTYNQSGFITLPAFDVLDTKVEVYARHTYDGDFELTLYSPDANSNRNRKCIEAFNGDAGQDIIGASVNDTNSLFFKDGTPPYTGGFFKPDYPFRGLNGINAAGNWSVITYDRGPGDVGTVDSIRMTLLRTSGTLSSNARLDNPADSVIDFGSAAVLTVKNFYLKNTGTSSLSIPFYFINGTYASKFSVINSIPPVIVPNDSALFQVQFDPAALEKTGSKQPMNTTESFQNALLNIQTNDPSKTFFKVSLLNDAPLPVELASFTSVQSGRELTLNWSTSSEHNNAGFDIESRISEDNSTDAWVRNGFVSGNGNSGNINSYSFRIRNMNTGKYNFRLKQLDFNGNYKYYNLQNEIVIGLPAVFYLDQNYPNPFNPITNISYGLPNESNVSIKIFDIQGREVFSFAESKPAGYYTLRFDASALSSGIYFYRLDAENSVNNFVNIKKMMVIK